MEPTSPVLVLVLVAAAALLPGRTLAADRGADADKVDAVGEGRAPKLPAAPGPADIADLLLRRLRHDFGVGGQAGVGGGGEALAAFMGRNYKKMAQTILPLLVGFKATGLLVMAMAITKFVLLKALFLSTTALLVAGLLALKKFLTSAGQPHDVPAVYTYQHQDLSHVPYLHPHSAASDYVDTAAVHMPQMPQVTYIGGSYGLQSIPYAATAVGGIGAAGAADDAQGLYSSHSGSVAALSQLQQLQQLQQQALLAQQLGNATSPQLQQQQPQPQAGQLLQLSRRRLSAPPGAAATASSSSQYAYRPGRPEARPA